MTTTPGAELRRLRSLVADLDAVSSLLVERRTRDPLAFRKRAGRWYLQTGEHKTFENELSNMIFERRMAAPNGEDLLYVFYNRETGVYVLLRYNLIEQQVTTPLISNGVAFFEAGEMVCFKSQDELAKHHAIQTWQTPYVSENYVPHTNTDSFL